MKKSIRALRRAQKKYRAAIRSVLISRTELCDPGCKGWFLDAESDIVCRCDECANLNGYASLIDDIAIRMLPEVWRALNARRRRDRARAEREERAA